MNQTEQSSTDQFTAFVPVPLVKDAPRSSQGNILKDINFQRLELGQLQPTSPRSSAGEPKVIVNRSGDLIESIEFICTCGCTKSVSFNYEGE
jgi:hypothetical protein